MSIKICNPINWKPENHQASQRGEVDFYSPKCGTRTAIIHGEPDSKGRPLIRVRSQFLAVDVASQKITDVNGRYVPLERVYEQLN